MNRRADRLVMGTAAALIIGAAPAVRVAAVRQDYGLRSLAVAAVAVVVAVASQVMGPRLRWPSVLAIAAVGGLAAGLAGGRTITAWVAVTIVVALVTTSGARLPPVPSFDRRVVWPIVGLSLASAFAARNVDHLARALALLGVTVVMTVVAAWYPEVIVRGVRSVARAAGAVLSVVLLAVMWVPCVLLPWIFHRLTRYDPLAPPRRGSAWIAMADQPVTPDRLWFGDPAAERPPLRRRLHAKAPGLLAVAALVAVLVGMNVDRSASPPPNEAQKSLLSHPWSDSLRDATNKLITESWLSQWAGVETPDISSPYLNIRNGQRRSWTPPPCGTKPLRVWLFGGSASLGIYQRDDETVASALARAAHRNGVELAVTNWSVPSDVTWQQNRRLERAVVEHSPPDVVVYYGGFNDTRAVEEMDFSGRGRDPDFVGPMDRLHMRTLDALGGIRPGQLRLFRVPKLTDPAPSQRLLDQAVLQYREGLETAQLLADHSDTELVTFFQPTLASRAQTVSGEPGIAPPAQKFEQRFRARAPEDVIDLGATLDGVRSPLFWDDVHTIEAANPLIGSAMYEHMRPMLSTLADDTSRGRCP